MLLNGLLLLLLLISGDGNSLIVCASPFTMRSSLSLKERLAEMGFAVGGPRRLWLRLRPPAPPPPPPMVRKPDGVWYVFWDDRSTLPKNGASHILKRGKRTGRLVVMTATNVSRVPHAPASAAPRTGSLVHMLVRFNGLNSRQTYHENKDTLHDGTNKHKDTCSQNEGRSNFLNHLQAGSPQHGKGDSDEVYIGRDVCGERHPDDGPGDGSLAGSWSRWLAKAGE